MSGQPKTLVEGMKTFVNQTTDDIIVTMFIREGNSPDDIGNTQSVAVASGAQVKAVYEGYAGSDGYVFLDGLLVEWADGGNYIGVSRRVVQRGDAWDNILNTNDTVKIHAVAAGTLNATGTNK